MKISLLGPTNLLKFSVLLGKPISEIESSAKDIGHILGRTPHGLRAFFNYAGLLKLIGDAYKQEGGKLEMLYTDNDYDWETLPYQKHLAEANVLIKKSSWHDMLLSLVSDAEIVLCAGLSAGVFAELGYIKWNYQEKKGKLKMLIGIKELLREGQFPPEIGYDLKKIIQVISIKDLAQTLQELDQP